MQTDESLEFLPEQAEGTAAVPDGRPWKILIVDDDPDVHSMTSFILRELVFEGRKLELLHAKSGIEARVLLQSVSDVAVALVDVVMETDRAGLDLVRYIRHDMGNRAMAVILRTGYPGAVPERSVIFEYEINDYKCKTELTAERLTTSVIAGLRYNSLYWQMVEARDSEVEALIQVYQTRRELLELQARKDAERHAELRAIADTIEMETMGRLSNCLKDLGEILWPTRMEFRAEMGKAEFERMTGQLDSLAKSLDDLRMANRSIIEIVRTS